MELLAWLIMGLKYITHTYDFCIPCPLDFSGIKDLIKKKAKKILKGHSKDQRSIL